MKSDSDLKDWVSFAADLRPLEQLALIGLLQVQPALLPSTIEPTRIVGEEKCYRASTWLTANIRALLHAYCRFCAQAAVPIGGKPENTMDLVAAAASLLMATQNIALAPAVGFAAWAVQSGVKLWCSQFGVREIDGSGAYAVLPYANYDGDFDYDGTILEFQGHFEASFYPAIQHYLRDPQYTHRHHEIKIDSPARADGCFIPAEPSCLLTIADHHAAKHEHRVTFRDTRTNGQLAATLLFNDLQISTGEVRFDASHVSWSDV